MKLASIKQGSGPGSSISLDQETIRVRNAVIKRFIDKPIDELNQFIEMELQTEIDETKRLEELSLKAPKSLCAKNIKPFLKISY